MSEDTDVIIGKKQKNGTYKETSLKNEPERFRKMGNELLDELKKHVKKKYGIKLKKRKIKKIKGRDEN